MSHRYPPYIDHSADYNSGLPYSFVDARYFNFVLMGDMQRLQRLCDRYINLPSNFGVSVMPLTPFVIVTFADYPKAYSEALPPEKYGYMRYQEAVFTIVLKTRKGACGLGGEIVSFIPFLFLDNPRAIAAGREVFSLPKVHGRVTIPSKNEYSAANQFRASLVTLPSTGPYSQARNCEILRVEAPSGFELRGLNGTDSNTWSEIDTHVGSAFDNLGGMTQEASRALTRSMQLKFINLRQFRSFPDTLQAAQQSIFQYQARNISFSNGGPLIGDFSLSFPEESPLFPIASSMGIEPSVISAYWYDWSFQFVLGKDLWKTGMRNYVPRPR